MIQICCIDCGVAKNRKWEEPQQKVGGAMGGARVEGRSGVGGAIRGEKVDGRSNERCGWIKEREEEEEREHVNNQYPRVTTGLGLNYSQYWASVLETSA